jgi:hypothetical protein
MATTVLDAAGMDTAVGDQLFQSQAGNLAAHGVKAGEDNCFRECRR